MTFASVGDNRIAYDEQGKGAPALLFMPGWCADRTAFDDIAASMASRHQTLAMDWRGHGESTSSTSDFGMAELADDAVAVIEASGADSVVPVATAHAGWVAIELRRRLGERIPKIVLVDWLVTDAPPPFLAALTAMSDPSAALSVRDQLFGMWTSGVEHPGVLRFVHEVMGKYPPNMWARAAREIKAAYERAGNPLRDLAALDVPVPTLHVYAQPDDQMFFEAQQTFAVTHPWFSVRRLSALSHFPTIEVPRQVEAHIDEFVSG